MKITTKVDEQEIFEKLLPLKGTEVEVALSSTGEKVRGTVLNVMFDSFFVEAGDNKRVISFADIMFLERA